MKIMFIVGSLVEKKNGVADYVINLCNNLKSLGHEIAIVSINDYDFISYNQNEVLVKNITRLSNKISVNERTNLLKRFTKDFKPDWISLQFVSYSYHKKGYPFVLLRFLKGLNEYPLHIMFHELWVDYEKTDSFKNKIIGYSQKWSIQYIIVNLKPKLLTTNIQLFINRLFPLSSHLLPLFGNINPISKTLTTNSKEFNVVFFASFSQYVNDFIKQLEWIKNYALLRNLEIKFNVIGNNRQYKESSFLKIREILGQHSLIDFGESSNEKVSEVFQIANMGVSSADYFFFGKSGSTISMLEHGLPVLLRGSLPKSINEDETYIRFKNQLIFAKQKIENLPEKAPVITRQKEIAENMISLLISHK